MARDHSVEPGETNGAFEKGLGDRIGLCKGTRPLCHQKCHVDIKASLENRSLKHLRARNIFSP